MLNSERYEKALEFAIEMHKGQYRMCGAPYITHPMYVAQYLRKTGYDEDYQITGLFHDLLEDTKASEEDILKYGNNQILKTVKLLTKRKGYIMSEYVKAIKEDKMAFVVKNADRLHNLISAKVASKEFKKKYILETVEWYLDFSFEIKKAVKELAETLDDKISEISFIYQPIELWNKG